MNSIVKQRKRSPRFDNSFQEQGHFQQECNNKNQILRTKTTCLWLLLYVSTFYER